MGIMQLLFGCDYENKEKKEEKRIAEKRKENFRLKDVKIKEELKKRKVLKIEFRCLNCFETWIYKYPAGIRAGSTIHGWTQDNFNYDYSLYEYNCPNCNENNLEIIERKPIKIRRHK